MEFGQNMDTDDPKVDLEGQGHRSKVKVTRSKFFFRSHLTGLQVMINLSLRSRVTWVKDKGHGQRSTLKVKVKGH